MRMLSEQKTSTSNVTFYSRLFSCNRVDLLSSNLSKLHGLMAQKTKPMCEFITLS